MVLDDARPPCRVSHRSLYGTDRVCRFPRHFMPGYHHLVPTEQTNLRWLHRSKPGKVRSEPARKLPTALSWDVPVLETDRRSPGRKINLHSRSILSYYPIVQPFNPYACPQSFESGYLDADR